ncbi:MAG: DNA-protecting protein DprA [Deltaproteobacteria bacterium]|nr:DNA-protecting protein DprA [Deltaproteobacteria bacterium]
MTDSPSTKLDNLFDWLALERIPRVGPLTIARLIDAFGSPGAAMAASADEIRRRTRLSENLARSVAESVPARDQIERDVETLDRLRSRVITRWDRDYPANLKDIYDPPAILFRRGQIIPEDSRAVAMVGTRNPSRYGREIAETLARDLAAAGVTIVSGLARGIDTVCHAAALKAGGRTIGVLGCGIDVKYPKENTALMEDIASSGAVVTEFRPGIPPLATNFFRRNRIVSGLSRGIVVVEASRNSGSLITAEHALDQNRDVFAVPGNILNLRAQGCHHLIKQGAGLVESAQDVLDATFGSRSFERQVPLFQYAAEVESLSDIARRVLAEIEPDPVSIDALCESLRMEPGKLAGILLELELKGLVRQAPGKMFARAAV